MGDTESTTVDIVFDEDDDHTDARATLRMRGVTFTGWGRARRNPDDPNLPLIGEELAVARSLSDLSHKLVEAAAEAISDREGRPAHVTI